MKIPKSIKLLFIILLISGCAAKEKFRFPSKWRDNGKVYSMNQLGKVAVYSLDRGKLRILSVDGKKQKSRCWPNCAVLLPGRHTLKVHIKERLSESHTFMTFKSKTPLSVTFDIQAGDKYQLRGDLLGNVEEGTIFFSGKHWYFELYNYVSGKIELIKRVSTKGERQF